MNNRFSFASFNVNGIRAAAGKGLLPWIAASQFDFVCLQETKAREHQLTPEISDIDGYESFWCSGERPGYSGVAVYARHKPLSVSRGFGLDPEFDREGRILILEYPCFTLINIYFPNGQKDDIRLRYKLDFYEATLKFCQELRGQGRELVICGDYNTAHNEIDLARPKENENVSGFLRVERDWMDRFEAHGYIDSFRGLNPDTVKYSWWSYRAGARPRNVGWRLDYFYITPGLRPHLVDAQILNDIEGSDHCPVTMTLEF